MPKAALLHAHLDATVNTRILLQLCLEQPAIHVRVSSHLTTRNIKTIFPEFKALPRAQFGHMSSLTDFTYIPGEWVPLHKARETFDASLGGPDGFDEWIISALMISPSEAYGTHNSPSKVCRYSIISLCLFSDKAVSRYGLSSQTHFEFVT